jgi:hypothetical protein
MSSTTAALVLSWLAIAVLALAVAGLLRQVRELQLTVYRGVGTQFVSSTGLDADQPRLHDVGPSGAKILLKVDSRCGVCDDAVDQLAAIACRGDNALAYVAVTDTDRPTWRRPGIHLIVNPELYAAIRAPWTPAVFAIDDDGRVVNAAAAGDRDALSAFIVSAQGVLAAQDHAATA